MIILWAIVAGVIGLVAGALIMRSREPKREAARVITIDPVVEREMHELRARADRLQSALDAMPNGVIVADAEGHVVVRNQAADHAGEDVHNEVLVQAAVQHHLRAALRGGERSQTVELYGPPRRVVIVHARPLGTEGAVATIEDVTERSRLDQVRTDFVANISHELKTPIGALSVLAETLIDETDPVVINRLATKTVNEAHRVAKIIDDLLELSRIELRGDLAISECDVAGLMAEATSRNSYAAEQRKVEVTVGEVPEGLTIHADSAQLASALGNLVDNAVKYSEIGGKVTLTAFPDSQGVTFTVTDSGIGIPARDLDRIFERFYRVDRARSRGTGGTGLGLSIVRHVASNHGGAVTVESREGEGSTFRLHIPDRMVPAQ
jgi:two-component system, OmpR family, sensor histidine kinase SenX3